MRFVPPATTIFWRPVLFSLALHVMVVVAMSVNWASQREVAPVKPVQVRHIEARLVDASVLQPKKQEKASKPAARPPPAPAKPRAESSPAPKPAPKAEPKAEPKPEPKPMPQPETGPTPDELRELAQRELALAMIAEDALLQQASDEEVAMSYVALISQTVQNNWSRPPSARNGMEAELVIQLIPTGEVVSVTVARSSGLLAFDRSAVNAVQKAERFPDLQKLPPRIFEKSFRQFRLLFKPEDLRY